MAKYTSDGNLIQGAATAYKNYDNAPGMYAGLDKVIEQGNKVFEEQMEKRRVVEKKFDDASEGVLLRSGALGKTLYGTATEDAKKFRELYIEGINTRDPNKKMEAMVGLQNLSDFVQDHKQTNLDIAKLRSEGDLSSYYEKNPKGREDAHLITQILEQSYSRVSENEEGEKVFHVKGTDGKEVMISNKEYKEMSSTLKNYNTGNGYIETSNASKEDEIWNEDTFRQGIKQVIPRSKGEFKAAAYDDISGTNLVDMLNSSTTLDQEIISAIDPKAWDADTDGVLDPEEKEAFIDAVTNVDNDFFNLGVSNQILEDQLTNAGLNSHTAHWQKINDEKAIKEQKALGKGNQGLNLKRGYVRYDQMAREHKLIGSGNEGDVFQFKYNGNDVTVRRQKDGRWKYNDGTETGMLFTPNQVKQISELHHLDDYEEPEEGYVNNEIPPLPPLSDAPTPNVENFAYNAGGFDGADTSKLSNIVLDWNEQYGEMGFSFKTEEKTGTGIKDARRKHLIVTVKAKNGKILNIDMGKRGGPSKENLAKTFNKFIEENKKNPETLKGRSPEEIKESVAKGEESKFNVGPDGELLSEGYTMNELGEVVWVGVGPEPTKK